MNSYRKNDLNGNTFWLTGINDDAVFNYELAQRTTSVRAKRKRFNCKRNGKFKEDHLWLSLGKETATHTPTHSHSSGSSNQRCRHCAQFTCSQISAIACVIPSHFEVSDSVTSCRNYNKRKKNGAKNTSVFSFVLHDFLSRRFVDSSFLFCSLLGLFGRNV